MQVLEITESKIRVLSAEEEASAEWKKMAKAETLQDKRMTQACRIPLGSVTGTLLPSKSRSR